MAYVTWDWDRDTGTGYPSKVEIHRLSPVVRSDTESGYQITRSKWTRDRWLIVIDFALIRPTGFIYLVDFFHAHRGGAAFYWMYPYGIYGIPEEMMTADPGGSSPWSSEVEPGFGDAPTWLCRFATDKLPLSRQKRHDNYMQLSEPIQLIQI
jgi:hypothetical protein